MPLWSLRPKRISQEIQRCGMSEFTDDVLISEYARNVFCFADRHGITPCDSNQVIHLLRVVGVMENVRLTKLYIGQGRTLAGM